MHIPFHGFVAIVMIVNRLFIDVNLVWFEPKKFQLLLHNLRLKLIKLISRVESSIFIKN